MKRYAIYRVIDRRTLDFVEYDRGETYEAAQAIADDLERLGFEAWVRDTIDDESEAMP